MTTQLRLAFDTFNRIETYDDTDLNEPCQECRRLDAFSTKIEFLTWLVRIVRRRYPNATLAQIRTRLVIWLNNHPAIRDALLDGEGW